jgi:hypothetical protein
VSALEQVDANRLAPAEAAELGLARALAADAAGRGTAALWLAARRRSPARAYLDAHAVAAVIREADDPERMAEGYRIATARAGESEWFGTRAAVLAFRLEDEAGFLALARRLLATRARADVLADPALRELAELAALRLSAHPFDARVIELAESLGPPRELADRLDAAADAALLGGRPKFALAAYAWLAEHGRNRFLAPYYEARQTIARLAGGDARGFVAGYRELATRALGQAPTRRRPLEWDRQLLFATRDAVPLLTLLADHAPLQALVETLSRYLRDAGPARSYAELTELYRVASAQLPVAGSRPYAEKVGAARAPLVLGEVQVGLAHTDLPPPRELIPPVLAGPGSLLCLPAGESCRRWAGPEAP